MSHTNISLLSQILALVNRNIFEKTVKNHESDKHSKGINTWTHLVSMIFMQLSGSESIRDVATGILSATGNLNHLGIKRAPSKSSISYLNKNRDSKVFEDLYFKLLENSNSSLTSTRMYAKKIKNQIFIMDSTIIPLSLSLFDWAKFRTSKGAIKLHAVLDYDSGLPSYACISEGKKHDVKVAKELVFPKGSVVVADRAYVDFDWLNELDSTGVFFVTRLKSNAHIEIVKSFAIKRGNCFVLSDEEVKLTGFYTSKKYPKNLRVVSVYDERNDQDIVLLTNQMSWTAQTVSELYRSRWAVETFFKHLKQLFRVKSFIGTSENAVRIQMWCSMIAILLLKLLKTKAKFKWHLSNLITFIRINLFVKIDLWEWLNHPLIDPKKPPDEIHLFSGI